VVEDRLPASEEGSEAEIRRLVAGARSADDFVEPLRLARELADRYPRLRDVQHLAAEIAYRASRWSEAVEFFGRGGTPSAERPELSFYEAVARFETGDLAGARAALERALPQIQRTPFVERYVSRIRGSASGSGG
jgi:Flp pilus assembly protein TadD